ncbi:hypothetical protein FLW53_09585 [Microbispora sp. SCL1-1]|uniref:hypothetical protein n=1 Tax=unclassified Microbispora TaxID=2614687 RepID=UPI00115B22D4|nr:MULTISPECIES: hypothetical protein [unclassified Microbispora]NJP24455.1 hypothetical protein [Microbispora sp. CL1-1]TQS14601.1 hypothetical protein FLW53_09585 [Microbispora sp. SCL1-1]
MTNDVAGWGGGGTPVRTDVSGLGFARQWAARYDTGSFVLSPQGAVTPGLTYTVSVYLRPESFPISGTVWIEFLDSGGGSLTFVNGAFSAPDGVVTRISMTGTAPTGAVTCWLVVTGENYAVNATSYTMCLIEQSASAGTYFDGSSPGAVWDGTPGNSTSTLPDAAAAPPPQSPYRRRRHLLIR